MAGFFALDRRMICTLLHNSSTLRELTHHCGWTPGGQRTGVKGPRHFPPPGERGDLLNSRKKVFLGSCSLQEAPAEKCFLPAAALASPLVNAPGKSLSPVHPAMKRLGLSRKNTPLCSCSLIDENASPRNKVTSGKWILRLIYRVTSISKSSHVPSSSFHVSLSETTTIERA